MTDARTHGLVSLHIGVSPAVRARPVIMCCVCGLGRPSLIHIVESFRDSKGCRWVLALRFSVCLCADALQANGERNYHVFYQLLAGGEVYPELKTRLALKEAEEVGCAHGSVILRLFVLGCFLRRTVGVALASHLSHSSGFVIHPLYSTTVPHAVPLPEPVWRDHGGEHQRREGLRGADERHGRAEHEPHGAGRHPHAGVRHLAPGCVPGWDAPPSPLFPPPLRIAHGCWLAHCARTSHTQCREPS